MIRRSIFVLCLPIMLLAVYWQALDGPKSGSAEDMSIGWDENIPAWTLYAADMMYRIYKSTDNGGYWDSIMDPYVRGSRCIITEASNAQVVYSGRGDLATLNPPFNVIFKSANGGQTWARVSDENVSSRFPCCFAMHPEYPETVYAGFDLSQFESGVYGISKSTDGGVHWTNCGSFPHTVRDIFIHPDDPQIIYIATSDSVWKSTDGGNSWNFLPSTPGNCNVYCITLNTTRNELCVSVEEIINDLHYCRIYKSTDDGINWTGVFTTPDQIEYEDPPPKATGLETDNSTSGQVMYATFMPFGFYKSTDYGDSWQASNNGIGDKWIISFLLHPDSPGCLFAGGCMALYRSTDYGDHWYEITSGMRYADPIKTSAINGSIACAAILRDAMTGFFSGMDGVTISTDGGNTWSWRYHTNISGITDIEIAPSNSSYILGGYDYPSVNKGFIIKTTDTGMNWVKSVLNEGITGITLSYTNPDSIRACTGVFLHPDKPKVIWTANGGDSWTTSNMPFDGTLATIETDPVNSYDVYTGGGLYAVDVSPTYAFCKSTDGCQTWSYAQTGLKGDFSTIAIDPVNNQTLYTGGDSGIFKSITAGTFWEKKKKGLEENYFTTDLAVDPEEPSIVYSLTQYDNYSTTNILNCSVDGARQWFAFILPPGYNPPDYVYDLDFDISHPDKLYAGSIAGVYSFFPQYLNKHLLSSSPEATSYNQGYKLAYVPGTGEIRAVYESGGVIYFVHTTDGGQSWSMKKEIGLGYNPCLETRNLPEFTPSVVWVARGDQDTIYFAIQTDPDQWLAPVPVCVSTTDEEYGPPSYVVGNDENGHLTYSVYNRETNTHTVVYRCFDLYDPGSSTPEDVGAGIDPAIGYLASAECPTVHIVWENEGGISHRARGAGGWGLTDVVSDDGYLTLIDSHHPSLQVAGDAAYVVFDAEGTDNQPDVYWRWVLYDEYGYYWSWIFPVCNTGNPSAYPVLTTGFFCSWMETINGKSEIYYAQYDPMLWTWGGATNLSNSADIQSGYPHLAYQQNENGTHVYFLWTENNAPAYDIRFHDLALGGGGGTGNLGFYAAQNGRENKSPFTLRRAGIKDYGAAPYQKADYDGQYLHYRFNNLDPNRDYGIKVQFYQHEAANLSLSVKVNDVAIAGICVPKDSLITLYKRIPAVLYQNKSTDLKIYGSIAVSGTMVLYEYERTKPKGGAQDAGTEQIQAHDFDLVIYPIPARREFMVEYVIPVKTNVVIGLYDVTGRLIAVLCSELQVKGKHVQHLKIDELPQGVYFLRFEASGDALVRKVTVLK